ncbi:uncharacterized protein LOC125203467 isoform X2 [Salvia hispanica]|uniref:uncharacterized protein LOC125203467 isoform X2 n=1 Tax=Salvia hispanica TaxID=49212 RepID=UPI00200972E2|nr:uncharacterized protein LOC125203467 isoform X2 [Salvia hispanica]
MPPDFPSPPHSSSLQRYGSEMHKDHILNTSPRPSHHLHSDTPLGKTSLHKMCSSSASDTTNLISSHSHYNTTSKSSAELVREIATLEVEILRLEHLLLSLYRTAFQQHLPRITEDHVETPRGGGAQLNQPSQETESKIPKDHQCESSPTSSLGGPPDLVHVSLQKSSSETGREKHRAYSRHRSLADYLGNCRTDDALSCPARLSEDIIRCMSSIYCKLANPMATEKSCSVSPTSSFCSSTRNLSGSWSPQCNDEVTQSCDLEILKQENGPYAGMVQVLKLCLDDESYNYAAVMLQRFRSLVKSLEIVEPMKMRHEEKLAFWINIHNALVMHAYLAYGTQLPLKSRMIVKAAYNIGGHCVNAYDIQSSILGIKSHYSAPWLQKLKGGKSRHPLAIEYQEPLVHFAVSSGAYSDPAVRVYRANSIFEDLKVAKEEFIQATVYVHKEAKIYLPRILGYYTKDMSLTMAAILDVVSECLPEIQQKSMRACVKGRPEKYVYWLEQASSFRYLIHKEL